MSVNTKFVESDVMRMKAKATKSFTGAVGENGADAPSSSLNWESTVAMDDMLPEM